MKLKRLILKNIRSYENQTIDFPDGVILLAGDIGTGKTTILLAIEYALFGLQPGQKGSALLRNKAEVGEVTMEFEVSGKEVIIERKIKRSSKSVNNDYAAITIDNRKLESSITEVKTKILNLLGYPQEFLKKNNILYRYTVYTPQEHLKQIITEDSEVRLNVLRHIFGVDKYKKIRENLVILLNRLKEEIKVIQSEIKSLDKDKESVDLLREVISNLSLKLKDKEREIEAIKVKRNLIDSEVLDLESKLKEKNSLESEIDKTKILIASKKETLGSILRELSEIKKLISESGDKFNQSELDSILNDLEDKRDRIDFLNSNYIETVGKIKSLQESISETDEKMNRVFKLDLCPTCLQNVSEVHKHSIQSFAKKSLSDYKIGIEKLSIHKDVIFNELTIEKEKLRNLEEIKNNLILKKSRSEYLEISKNRSISLEKQKEVLEKDIDLLTKHIGSLKEGILKLSTLDNLFKIKRQELLSVLNEERNLEISIAETNKETELTNRQISMILEEIGHKEEKNRNLIDMIELSDWLSNSFLNLMNFIEKNVMLKLRVEFSRLFSKWFHTLVPEESFSVQLDENFTPLILQREVEMEYAFLSGGERTAVALAYRLALNQTINSIISTIKTKELIILDEPTEGLSETQVEKMREIFSELNVAQLIVVSHETKVESFVDKVIRVKKVEDVSTIFDETNLSNSILEIPEEPKNLNSQ